MDTCNILPLLWYHGIRKARRNLDERDDMSKIEEATIATQKIILELVEKKGMDEDEFSKQIGVSELYRWLNEPLMSYSEFLSACMITKTSATEMFRLTKESLSHNQTQDKKEKPGTVPPEKDVDSQKAQLSVAGDVLMRWSSVLESISKDTHQDIGKVRGLFNSAPHVINNTTLEINARSNSEKARNMLKALIMKGVEESKIINHENLNLVFADA